MTISNIRPEEEDTWVSRMFVEIDVDWAPDEIIDDTISLLEKYNVDATFFSTHKSDALSNISRANQYEIGVHPNFIPLLKGDDSKGADYKEVISRIMDIVPDAKSAKAHSLVDSSLILHWYNEVGITHDNTYFIDSPDMQPLVPWRLWNDIIRVPLYWEDDYACVTKYQLDFDNVLKSSLGVKVFGFHPLHIFLNTESLDRYELVRTFQNDPKRLIDYRFEGDGTRSRFIKLLKLLSKGSTCQ